MISGRVILAKCPRQPNNDPRTIVDKLETEAKTAKSALKLVLNGTAAEALQSNMQRAHQNVSNFDRVPPKGFGFDNVHSKNCLWCAFCESTGKHKRMGWNGWNQISVTGCAAHIRGKCPYEKKSKDRAKQRKRKGKDKENKGNNSNSLQAQVATLTALVTELSKKV